MPEKHMQITITTSDGGLFRNTISKNQWSSAISDEVIVHIWNDVYSLTLFVLIYPENYAN